MVIMDEEDLWLFKDPLGLENWRTPFSRRLSVSVSLLFLKLSQINVKYCFLGYPILDANGPDQNGFLVPQSTIRRGGRCSTAKAYLYSVRDRKNLHVVTFAHVVKILFNQYKEAIGVVFDRFGTRHKVFARKEIILSAGSINTPQLLMLSGKNQNVYLFAIKRQKLLTN